MLSAQQAAAKEAAHRQFDYPPRVAAERHGDREGRDNLPRYRPGVEGIGVAGDTLRIYVLQDLAADLETPPEIAGLRTERILNDRLFTTWLRPDKRVSLPLSAAFPSAMGH